VTSLSEERPTYVVCWTRDERAEFFASETWAYVRDLFEERVAELAPGHVIEQLRGQYPALDRGGKAGGGIAPAVTRPVGIFRALVASPEGPLEAFLCFGHRMVPVIGSAALIEQLAEDVKRRDPRARCHLYRAGDREPPDRPPSELRATPRARRAADQCIGHRDGVRAATTCLSSGELLWVGMRARDCEHPMLALRVAERALQHAYTPGGLNLKGAAYRDLVVYDQSLAAYDESINICSSARNNPYGHIGRAATLRRLSRSDEAYDAVKKALRFWPNDPYALRVRNAIVRGSAVRSEAPPLTV
jgi:hypothetical protein